MHGQTNIKFTKKSAQSLPVHIPRRILFEWTTRDNSLQQGPFWKVDCSCTVQEVRRSVLNKVLSSVPERPAVGPHSYPS